MTPHDFFVRFNEINVCLDRARIETDAAFSVEKAQFSPNDWSQIYTPWYVDSEGAKASWDDEGAISLSISKAIEFRPVLNLNEQRIALWQQRISRGVQLDEMPAFRVAPERYLLLDGNHRMMALAASGQRISVAMIVLVGPIDASVLPDLKHWQTQPL